MTPSTPAGPPEERVGGPRRSLILASLMVAMALAAIEGTIVATAMPSIVARLGGFEIYGWVFAAYLLTQAVTTPIYGSLADLYGRKPVLVFGITLFLAGSVACGFAPTMLALVAFRAVQGLGAGAIHTTVMTLAGDLYPARERGRIQGFLSSVWGVAALLGPVVGAAAVAIVGWPWVFWFNVPFGLLALVGVGAFVRERVAPRQVAIDLLGAFYVLVSIASLMLVLTGLGAWSTGATVALGGMAVAALAAFVAHERRVAAPLIPPALFGDRLIAVANAATLAAGMTMIGLTSFVPPYVQGVLGRTPLVAGLAYTTMSIGWPMASFVAGRLLVPWGPSRVARLGGLALAMGGTMFLLLEPSRGAGYVAFASFVVGCGFGLLLTTLIVTIQASVPWERRGAATSSNLLMRVLGSALGAALLGAVFTTGARRGLEGLGAGTDIAALRGILDPHGAGAALDPALAAALASGLHGVFDVVFVLALVAFVIVQFLPRDRRLD